MNEDRHCKKSMIGPAKPGCVNIYRKGDLY